MVEIGLNLETLQAIAALATAFGFFAVAISTWYTRRQVRITEESCEIATREFALRTRAWMSLRSVDLLNNQEIDKPVFQFKYENMGETPADNLHISIQLTRPHQEIILDKELGIIFPHGYGFDTFQIANCWQRTSSDSGIFDVEFQGQLNYSSAGQLRCTSFTGQILWQDGFKPGWRNVKAT